MGYRHNSNLKPATTTTISTASPIIPSPSPVSSLRFPPVGASPTLPVLLGTAPTLAVVPPAAPSPAPVVVTGTATPAVDFVEDPFKDYRYEDPFAIEDPFADDGEDVGDKSDPFAANTNPLSNRAVTPKDRLEDLFGDALNNNFGALDITDADRFTPSTSSSIKRTTSSATADPFDAFNDNFSKKSNTDQETLFRAFGTTAAAAFPETKNASPFGDDDAFGKMDFSNNNNSSSRNGASDSFDFANFGAFNTNLSKSSSSVGSLKRQGALRGHDKKQEPPLAVKFNEDYSKDDLQFEADLQSILERSKIDQ
ncbi:conserved hypothetical protein [Culex quinquefasciatus]|uniref:Uncharacterized protein n=1 Tax=Culex quinquefasciatus TaxID=7176 RepID=B0XGK7_CULQU|nr:conserved hypothetical protein [Culex quinquefasciatus]|eukprot:XP_001868779.1 conserved hypothetical protein [Culex quinquefasciatus]